MPPRVMTERAYVRAGGNICPYCRGGSITGDNIEVNGSQCILEISCGECGAEWIDQYNLSSFSLTKPPDEEEQANEDPNEK